MEEEGKALDEVIETIDKTMRSSIRSRVLATWAKDSREQGNLGIASLSDTLAWNQSCVFQE
jgi:hypothetical protein